MTVFSASRLPPCLRAVLTVWPKPATCRLVIPENCHRLSRFNSARTFRLAAACYRVAPKVSSTGRPRTLTVSTGPTMQRRAFIQASIPTVSSAAEVTTVAAACTLFGLPLLV